jgi:hypothetical protein
LTTYYEPCQELTYKGWLPHALEYLAKDPGGDKDYNDADE